MDSGPQGESYLATRMLPDPDEAGDYRWPNVCTCLLTSSVVFYWTDKSPSCPPHSHQYHIFNVVFSSLSNGK